jgi:uncharacterized protein (DUF2141 family)
MLIVCSRLLRQTLLLLGLVVAVSPSVLAANQTSGPCTDPNLSPAAPHITVTVAGIRYAGGNVALTLYGDDPARFLAHRGAIDLIRVPVTANTVQACFAVSSPGTYSVAVYDDPHNHYSFDRTMLGLPGADYGFSNNPRIFLAPPGFRATAFVVPPGGTHIVIRLHR